eukprot:TRINITY_DN4162_c0_g1_i1.p1 TRINITY_DN4162_c0_g1~~TRINITY_DN4162_c0_g1_i1.p1  ORF type:complete len:1087 (+),score=291.60 TRINITY_DN4162_c0_g1_i1:13-3273(+)
MSSANVRVICRFRPFNKREQGEIVDEEKAKTEINFIEDHTVEIKFANKPPAVFTFDKVFSGDCTQEDIYNNAARETIEDVIKGYNGTIFAYGQTGAGKSWTMFGPEISEPHLKGIIPRSCSHIFDHINSDEEGTEYIIRCSFLEIYKEIIRDLLNPSNNNLKVRETKSKGVWVDGLTEVCVSGEGDVLDLLKLGEQYRAVASTDMNAESSRSHSLFILNMESKSKDGSTQSGRLNLADLAGSEKVGKTGAKGDTLEEAKKINQSLSALGNCIKALTSNKGHTPYRDSKLTFVLKESLGGNAKTTLLIACSSHMFNLDETVSTLRFGKRAKEIKNRVTVNKQRSVKELEMIVKKLTHKQRQFQKYTTALENLAVENIPEFDLESFKSQHFGPVDEPKNTKPSSSNNRPSNSPSIEEISNALNGNEEGGSPPPSNIEVVHSAPVTPVDHKHVSRTEQLSGNQNFSTPQPKSNLAIPRFDELKKRIPKIFTEEYEEESFDYFDPMALAESQLAYDKMKENMFLDMQDLRDDLETATENIKTLRKANNEYLEQIGSLEKIKTSLEIIKEELELELEAKNEKLDYYTAQHESLNSQLEHLNNTILEFQKDQSSALVSNEQLIREYDHMKKQNTEYQSQIQFLERKIGQLDEQLNDHSEEVKDKEKSIQHITKKLKKVDQELDAEKKKTIKLSREFQVEKQLSHTKLIIAEQKIQFLEQKLRFNTMSTTAQPAPSDENNTSEITETVEPNGTSEVNVISPRKSNENEAQLIELQSTVDDMERKIITLESELESLLIDCNSKQKLYESEKEEKTKAKQELKKLQRQMDQMKLQNEIDSMRVLTRIQDAETKQMYEETRNMKLEKELEEKNKVVMEQEWKIKTLLDQINNMTTEKNNEQRRIELNKSKLSDQAELIEELQMKIRQLESNGGIVPSTHNTRSGGIVIPTRSSSRNTYNFADFMRNHLNKSRETKSGYGSIRQKRRARPSVDTEIQRSDEKKGYLIIQENSGRTGSWKRYWFVVNSKQIHYYKNDSEDDQTGSINLTNIEEVQRADSLTTKPYSFMVRSGSTQLFLRTSDEDTCEEWIKFFQTLMQ